jgi:hypothetical protein
MRLTHAVLALFMATAANGQAIRMFAPPGGTIVVSDPTDPAPVLCDGASCAIDDVLFWDSTGNCLDCCEVGVDEGCVADVTPCDTSDCNPGDVLVWNAAGTCWRCCDPLFETCTPTPANVCVDETACEDGDGLSWNAISECFECCESSCDVAPCDVTVCEDGDTIVWNETLECFACIDQPTLPHQFIRRDAPDNLSGSARAWTLWGDPDQDPRLMAFDASDPPWDWRGVYGPRISLFAATGGGNLYLTSRGVGSTVGIQSTPLPGETFEATMFEITSGGDSHYYASSESGGSSLIVFGENPEGTIFPSSATGLDLGALDHTSAVRQGLRLPQGATGAFTDITGSTEGWIAWSTDDDKLMCNDGTAWAPCTTESSTTSGISVTIGYEGTDIIGGTLVYMPIPFGCTVTGFTLVADESGDVEVDILKTTYANFPASFASITSASPPALSSSQKDTDSTLTGWTTSITAGDVLQFYVEASPVPTVDQITLTLAVTK